VAYTSVSSVLNAKFLQRLSGGEVQSTSGTNSKQIQTESRAAVTATISGLSNGARIFSNGIASLNSLISFVNITRSDLTKLRTITEDMVEVVTKATKGGIGQSTRTSLNSDFETLATQFTRVLASASNRTYDGMKKDDFLKIFQRLGFDKDKSKTFAELLEKFSFKTNSDGKDVQATDTSQAIRPIRVPQSAYQTTIRTTYNNGDGTFYASSSRTIGEGQNIIDTKSGNFNNDTISDLVFLNSRGTVAVAIGNGDGTYKATVTYDFATSGNTFAGLSVVDYDGDGRDDITIAADDGANNVVSYTLLSNIDGSFGASVSTVVNAGSGLTNKILSVGVEIGNGIVSTDLVIARDNVLQIHDGKESGEYASSFVTVDTLGTNITGLNAFDINNDGSNDIIVSTDSGLRIYTNDGIGNFTLNQTLADAQTISSNLQSADLNNDGFTDLFANDSTTGQMRVWLNTSGTYSASTSIGAFTNINATYASDINNDGNLDIVSLSATDRKIYTSFGNGNGTFSAAVSSNTAVGANAGTFVDPNNDGLKEFITGNNLFNGQDNFTIYNSTATVVESTGRKGSSKDYLTLFDATRTIKNRPDAFKMLADMKALQGQIDDNLNGLDKAFRFVVDNMEMLRGVGLAFIAAAKEIGTRSINDPDAVAKLVQTKVNGAGLKVSQQIGNLNDLAALATTRLGQNKK
jgi:hypothetical protein